MQHTTFHLLPSWFEKQTLQNHLTIFSFSIIGILLLHYAPAHASEKDPTVYLIGDSTVKNGQGKGDSGLWGWGDFLHQYLDTTKVSVQNHALGGTSSRTFLTKGRWKPVLSNIKKGDYLFIQFGHNDSGPINDDFRARGTIKGTGDEKKEIDNMLTGEHEVVHSYGWYLRTYIRQAKEKGAVPVVVSPIPRNVWRNGKISYNNNSYGGWAKEVAESEQVAFIDLNKAMVDELNQYSEGEVTGKYFYKRDHTHTNARGALLAARFVSKGIQSAGLALKQYILENPQTHLPEKTDVFLIGDSTVADNGSEKVGWGTAIQSYFDTTRVRVHNLARGGRSSRTFRHEGLWQKTLDTLGKGDYVLIQFGHNDGGHIDQPKYRGSLKGMGNETDTVTYDDDRTEIVHTYGWYMKQYIREALEKGAEPIVLSMIPRNRWVNGRIDRANNGYGKWAREAVEQAGGHFIDLNNALADKYESMTREEVNALFDDDKTHLNAKGAQFNAKTVASLLNQYKHSYLRDYIYLPETTNQ